LPLGELQEPSFSLIFVLSLTPPRNHFSQRGFVPFFFSPPSLMPIPSPILSVKGLNPVPCGLPFPLRVPWERLLHMWPPTSSVSYVLTTHLLFLSSSLPRQSGLPSCESAPFFPMFSCPTGTLFFLFHPLLYFLEIVNSTVISFVRPDPTALPLSHFVLGSF